MVFQVVLLALLALGVWWIVDNTIENLRRSNISTGFAFLRGRAGFDISDSADRLFLGLHLWPRDSRRLLNTLVVAIAGIVTATIVGFLIGVGRLSRNWLIRKIATVYVEIFRNIPPLLVIFFWYLGVLAVLPASRDSIRAAVRILSEQSRLLFSAIRLGRWLLARFWPGSWSVLR